MALPANNLLSNIKRNGGLADPEWRRFVARWSGVSLLLIGVAAWFSYGFYHLDEYYQITEFTSYKLGKTPESELAWEYHRQSHPWLQPAIYYVAAKAAMRLGVENPFTLALIFHRNRRALRFLGGHCRPDVRIARDLCGAGTARAAVRTAGEFVVYSLSGH